MPRRPPRHRYPRAPRTRPLATPSDRWSAHNTVLPVCHSATATPHSGHGGISVSACDIRTGTKFDGATTISTASGEARATTIHSLRILDYVLTVRATPPAFGNHRKRFRQRFLGFCLSGAPLLCLAVRVRAAMIRTGEEHRFGCARPRVARRIASMRASRHWTSMVPQYRAAASGGGARRARLYCVLSAAEHRNRQTMSPSQCGAGLPTRQPDPIQPTLNVWPICPCRRGGAGGISSTIRHSSPCFRE